MLWVSIALTIGTKVFDILFGDSSDAVSSDELKAALREAVKDTRIAILDDRLNQLAAEIEALRIVLCNYNYNPSLTSRLDDADLKSLEICCQLQFLQHPHFPALVGLPGHTLFMVAAGLRTQVLYKRVEVYGDVEKNALKNHFINSIEHANKMNVAWEVFNSMRFQGPFPVFADFNFPNVMVQFAYKCDETIKRVGNLLVLPQDQPNLDSAQQAATTAMQSDIYLNWEDIRNRIVEPSQKIVAIWRKDQTKTFGRYPKTLSSWEKRVRDGFRRTLNPL